MSWRQPYDDNNIFAKIINGDMPATKIFEDENTIAFMDIFPQSRGHCLVIPKMARATSLLDIDPAQLATLIGVVQKVATAVEAALNPDGIRIAQFNGASAGQTVFHIHFHIIPIFESAPLGAHASGAPADSEDLQKLAAAIAAALPA